MYLLQVGAAITRMPTMTGSVILQLQPVPMQMRTGMESVIIVA